MNTLPEVWLRGSLPGIPTELQPAIHALMQAQEEVNKMLFDFPEELIWEKPAGVASPAFHLQHIAGFIDRLLSYKNKKELTHSQLKYLNAEGIQTDISLRDLLVIFNKAIDKAIADISNTSLRTLTEVRVVGRKRLPSTVRGLLFHIAEHTMRHTGQLLVTINVLKNRKFVRENL